MISTVVFDFDGTLVDSNAIKRQGFFDVVAGQADGPARMAKVLDRTKGDRHAVFTAYIADALSSELEVAQDIDSLMRTYTNRVDALVAAAHEMPGAMRLLQELRHNQRRLYLSSATPISSLRWIVEQRGWGHFFEGVFGHPASKRESLSRIRAIAATDVASLVVVGDGIDDRESAASIGCSFYAVGEARGRSETERVFTLPELLKILLDRAESFS